MKASAHDGKREDVFVAVTIWGSFILAAGIPLALLIAEFVRPFCEMRRRRSSAAALPLRRQAAGACASERPLEDAVRRP